MKSVGRPPIFKNPSELVETWGKYKKDLREVQSKHWPKIQYVGKDGTQRVDYPILPFTLEGFYRYCWENEIGDVHNYFENHEGRYDKFKGICRAIKQEIREQQITGGMTGFYNPSITQRLNGLQEKVQHEGGDKPIFMNLDTSDLDDEEKEEEK